MTTSVADAPQDLRTDGDDVPIPPAPRTYQAACGRGMAWRDWIPPHICTATCVHSRAPGRPDDQSTTPTAVPSDTLRRRVSQERGAPP